MIPRTLLAFLAIASLVSFALPLRAAEQAQTTISGPFTQSNLTVFLLHGKDTIPASVKLLTLDEALDQKKLIVHETSNVNELAIENVSEDVEVFVQSGDIVKGGKQDRLIACDMIVPPKSGKMPVTSFCCENGRWEKRGSESATEFRAGNAAASNKDLKLALNSSRNQNEVWNKVQESQKKLSDSVGKPVASPQSPSSYKLTLEDKELLTKVDAYTRVLKPLAEQKADVIGFVIVINGKVEGAELYGSHALFLKLWPKLIFGAAVDALAEVNAKKTYVVPAQKDVEKFLADASQGKAKEIASASPADMKRPSPGANSSPNRAPTPPGLPQVPGQPPVNDASKVKVVSTENDKSVLLEARDRKDDTIVHRSYIAK